MFENGEYIGVFVKKDLLSLADYSKKDILSFISLAGEMKAKRKKGIRTGYSLKQKNILMIFEKPSLRTRVTFEVAMEDLQGHAVVLPSQSVQMGKRESIEDIAHNVERWIDGIVARTFKQKTIDDLAKYANIPVINALSDMYHPCQALAFAQTLKEHKGRLSNLNVVFLGDGNNVCHSIMILCSKLGLKFTLAHPKGYGANKEVISMAKGFCEKSKGELSFTNDPVEAIKNADVIYTDTFTSMGQESEAKKRQKVFASYQLNSTLLKKAPKGCLVSHCLPAHRGEEITDEVLDNSMAFDEAENRLHAQKAVLFKLLKRK